MTLRIGSRVLRGLLRDATPAGARLSFGEPADAGDVLAAAVAAGTPVEIDFGGGRERKTGSLVWCGTSREGASIAGLELDRSESLALPAAPGEADPIEMARVRHRAPRGRGLSDRLGEFLLHSSTPDLPIDDVLRLLCEEAREITGAERVDFLALEGGRLVPRAEAGHWGSSGSRPETPDEPLVDIADLKEALREGRQLFTNDLERSRLAKHPWVRKFGVRAAMVLPIFGREVDFGILVFGHSQERFAFDAERQGEAEIFARQAALFLEKARVAQTLRESESRYRQLVEALPDAVAVHSEGRFVYLNAAALTLIGATRAEDVLGKPVLDFVHPDDREFANARIRAIAELGGRTALAAQRLVRADGGVVEAEVSGIATTYAGKPATLVVARNVSDRERASRYLAVQYEVTAILATAVSFEEAVPRALERILEGVGWPMVELWIEDSGALRRTAIGHDASVRDERLTDALQAEPGDAGRALAGRVRAGARPVWIRDLEQEPDLRGLAAAHAGLRSLLACPLAGAKDGAVLALYGRGVREAEEPLARMIETLGRQIGGFLDRLRAEQRLRESEEKFRRIFHEGVDGITLNLLREGTYLDVNREFLALTGYRRDEVVGRTPADLQIWVREEDVRSVVSEIRRNGFIRNLETEFRMKDGHTILGLYSAMHMEVSGRPCVLSFVRDVSDFRRAERELESSRQQLALSEKLSALGSLVSGVAHEIRTPTAYIANNLFLLRHRLEEAARSHPELESLLRDVGQ
ncbi:MAG: PAS domain S-box protein [Candidatus Binatia bacterium]